MSSSSPHDFIKGMRGWVNLYGQKTEPIQITVFQPLTDRPSDSKPAGRSLKTRFAKV